MFDVVVFDALVEDFFADEASCACEEYFHCRGPDGEIGVLSILRYEMEVESGMIDESLKRSFYSSALYSKRDLPVHTPLRYFWTLNGVVTRVLLEHTEDPEDMAP